jgi:hypothetical protein
MRVKTIAYGKTFNLGNYQTERIDMGAELDEGEDEQVAVLRLKAAVLGMGGDTQGAERARKAVALIEAETVYEAVREG